MNRAILAAAMLLAASAAQEFGGAEVLPRPDRGQSVRGWTEKSLPRHSAASPSGWGARVKKRRASAKQASKQRTKQRMQAKGKR